MTKTQDNKETTDNKEKKIDLNVNVGLTEEEPQQAACPCAPPSTDGGEDKDDSKILLITLIAIALVFAGVFVVKHFMGQPELPPSLQDKFLQAAKEGEGKDFYTYENSRGEKSIFVNYADLWHTQSLSGGTLFTIPLHFGPRDMENVTLEGSLDDRFINQSDVYITVDPITKHGAYIALAATELSNSLVKSIQMYPRVACTQNLTDSCENKPIITCDNTDKAVIFFNVSDEPKLKFDGNCITIEGSEWDIVRVTNRLLYIWYGIMDPW